MNIADKLNQILAKEDENIELNKELEDVLIGGENVKSYQDKFWDTFQDNGNRTDYSFAFAGTGWTDKILRPKYDIIVTSAHTMFKSNNGINENISDFFAKQGVKLDFSQCTSFVEAFGQPGIVGVDVVDTRNANNITSMCVWNNRLKEIRKLILKNDGSQTSLNAFVGTNVLETLFIEGVIGTDFLVQSKVLNRASIESIVNHLSDTVGATLTLNKSAVNKAFETSNGANNGSSSDDWLNLIASKVSIITGGDSTEDKDKENGLWTISLV